MGYNSIKPGRGSYPFVGFIGEPRDYLGGVYRPGNWHISCKALEILKRIIALVPDELRSKLTGLLVDSRFFSYRLMKWLIKERIEYFIVLNIQEWVQKEMQRVRFQLVSRGAAPLNSSWWCRCLLSQRDLSEGLGKRLRVDQW